MRSLEPKGSAALRFFEQALQPAALFDGVVLLEGRLQIEQHQFAKACQLAFSIGPRAEVTAIEGVQEAFHVFAVGPSGGATCALRNGSLSLAAWIRLQMAKSALTASG